MKIIDAHCDVLWKMWQKKYVQKEGLQRPFYTDADGFHVTKAKLLRGGIGLQACALYVDEMFARSRAFDVALEMIDLFHEEIISEETIWIRNRTDLHAWKNSNKLGLLLTLEGAEAVEADLVKLATLHRLGVRWVGLTHNPANAVADGVGEARGAGLSEFGKRFVEELNRLHIGIDVSHLSERGFWDVLERSTEPIFATHSNAKAICDHRRNLTDEQIRAIINNNGMIGVTYVPYFTAEHAPVTIPDLLRHIEHILSLGGKDHLGLGSDFDGIDQTIVGLDDSGVTYNLIEQLHRHYSHDVVERIVGDNWYALLERQLPAQ